MISTMATCALRYLRQAPVLIPLLVIAGVFLVIEHDGVIAKWSAMYPTDPREKAALQLCYQEDHQFNRLSEEARKGCYEKWLPRLADRQVGTVKMVKLHG
jgi:hypothetical protein